MIPGMNPRKMKQMMKQLGMDVKPIDDVQEIIIRTPAGTYTFGPVEVARMTIQGVATYQISGGEPTFEPLKTEIPAEDISLVAEQTGVTPEDAKKALEASGGDIADAILKLSDSCSRNRIKLFWPDLGKLFLPGQARELWERIRGSSSVLIW